MVLSFSADQEIQPGEKVAAEVGSTMQPHDGPPRDLYSPGTADKTPFVESAKPGLTNVSRLVLPSAIWVKQTRSLSIGPRVEQDKQHGLGAWVHG